MLRHAAARSTAVLNSTARHGRLTGTLLLSPARSWRTKPPRRGTRAHGPTQPQGKKAEVQAAEPRTRQELEDEEAEEGREVDGAQQRRHQAREQLQVRVSDLWAEGRGVDGARSGAWVGR